ncbi:MAG: DUF4910 domain-containing protein [Gammaproteobacteria bacterium]
MTTTLAPADFASPLAPATGERMYRLIEELYPICRSITGNGVRRTLDIIGRYMPLQRSEVPSGTRVFDWTVPKEWNIRDAYIRDPSGTKVVDFAKSNLHVVSYSQPVCARLPLAQLRARLHTLPEPPEWIPYRTSYYNETWGLCLSERQREALPDGEYEVVIDATLADGHLSYGEYLLPGDSSDEVLLSCHVCHPSLCNDNLSGIALLTELARALQARPQRRYSYRFLFIPGTIGSITWLARNEAHVARIRHGLVVTCVGDGGRFTYKKSRRGNADIDRAVMHVLATTTDDHEIIEFYPYGYDERQYCSPGFNLPVGSLSRSTHARYVEYHTSADDMQLVQPHYLAESLEKYLAVIDVLEHDRVYINTQPKCEPQLGRRGLYRGIGASGDTRSAEMALLWVLNLSDGRHGLLDIAERARVPFAAIAQAAHALHAADLLREGRRL